jgi:hypothetical protein
MDFQQLSTRGWSLLYWFWREPGRCSTGFGGSQEDKGNPNQNQHVRAEEKSNRSLPIF